MPQYSFTVYELWVFFKARQFFPHLFGKYAYFARYSSILSSPSFQAWSYIIIHFVPHILNKVCSINRIQKKCKNSPKILHVAKKRPFGSIASLTLSRVHTHTNTDIFCDQICLLCGDICNKDSTSLCLVLCCVASAHCVSPEDNIFHVTVMFPHLPQRQYRESLLFLSTLCSPHHSHNTSRY